jgi:hypothetical protein
MDPSGMRDMPPAGLGRTDLAEWLNGLADTRSVDSSPDWARSISSVLVRAIRSDEHTLAVGQDVKPTVAVGALLDLLAWHMAVTADGARRDRVTLMLAGQSLEVLDTAGEQAAGARCPHPCARQGLDVFRR